MVLLFHEDLKRNPNEAFSRDEKNLQLPTLSHEAGIKESIFVKIYAMISWLLVRLHYDQDQAVRPPELLQICQCLMMTIERTLLSLNSRLTIYCR